MDTYDAELVAGGRGAAEPTPSRREGGGAHEAGRRRRITLRDDLKSTFQAATTLTLTGAGRFRLGALWRPRLRAVAAGRVLCLRQPGLHAGGAAGRDREPETLPPA